MKGGPINKLGFQSDEGSELTEASITRWLSSGMRFALSTVLLIASLLLGDQDSSRGVAEETNCWGRVQAFPLPDTGETPKTIMVCGAWQPSKVRESQI